MRSEMGRIGLDRSFSERDDINDAIVRAVDEASDPWGIKVTRYEIQNIQLPPTVQESMEYQIKADRQKRAVIARSVGEKRRAGRKAARTPWSCAPPRSTSARWRNSSE